MASLALPRSVDEKKLPDHPVLIAMKKGAAAGIRRTDIARAMGVTPQSLVGFENRAREDRDYLIPAEHVKHYAKVAELPPWVFRPDVFERDWNYANGVFEKIAAELPAAKKPKAEKKPKAKKVKRGVKA